MVRIGWAEHEILWIRAASTLAFGERENAYTDISSMTGWAVKSIRCKAASLKAQDRQKARAFLEAQVRKNWLCGSDTGPPRRIYGGALMALDASRLARADRS